MDMEELERMFSMIDPSLLPPNVREKYEYLKQRDAMAHLMSSDTGPTPYNNLDPDDLERMVKRAQEVAEKEKNAIPMPIKTYPRRMLLDSMAAQLKERDDILKSPHRNKYQLRQNFNAANKYFSVTPLENLKVMSIVQLMIPKRHEGRYLLCRAISRPQQIVAFSLMVDDPKGQVILLSLYHFINDTSIDVQSLDSRLPIGSKLAIREPYVKMGSAGDGQPFVRVDAISDVVVLNEMDQCLAGVTWKYDADLGRIQEEKSALKWKEEGNKAFKVGRPWVAISAYQSALKVAEDNDTHATILLNLSAAFLQVDKPGSAYTAASKSLAFGLSSISLRIKCLHRQATAAYKLQCFLRAEQLLIRALNLPLGGDTTTKDTLDSLLVKTRARLVERKTGNHDFVNLYRLTMDGGKTPRIEDVANYWGPVELKEITGKGRGICLSRDVEPGDVLIVSKAMACSYFHDPEAEHGIVLSLSIDTKSIDRATQTFSRNKLVHAIMDNPALVGYMSELHDKSSDKRTPHTRATDTDEEKEKYILESLRNSVNLDVSRMERIFNANSFGYWPLKRDITITHEEEAEQSPSMLFHATSFFNHSCIPNTIVTLYGDVMVVRALHRLVKGDELSVSYGAEQDFERRKQRFKAYGFQCQCDGCSPDISKGSKERTRLLDDQYKPAMHSLQNMVGAQKGWEPAIGQLRKVSRTFQSILAKMDSTYPANVNYRADTQYVWHALANATASSDKKQAIQFECKSLEVAGAILNNDISESGRKSMQRRIMLKRLPYHLDDSHIGIMMVIALMHRQIDNMALYHAWMDTATWAHNAMAGGGKELFKLRCANQANEFGITL